MSHRIHLEKTQKSRINEVDFANIPFGKVFTDHMFVSDYIDGAWQNHRIIPFGPFSIHPACLALHYGQSIFEGLKASKSKDGEPMFFRLDRHALRLNRSAERMCMPAFPEELFMEATQRLIALDSNWIPPQKGSALYIRPLMFANGEFVGVKPSDNYRLIIFAGPVGPYYTKPVDLLVAEKYVRAVPGGPGEAKAAGNYGGAMLPSQLAKQKGYDQILWVDGFEFKHIQEVGTMNIFFVIDNTVVTPALNGAILHGITRDSFIQICREKGIAVEERPITIDEVADAHQAGTLQEVFGAGTAAVVAHVASITHGEHRMELPSVENRPIGKMLKDYIDGVRYGTIEDTHGWITKVKIEKYAESDYSIRVG